MSCSINFLNEDPKNIFNLRLGETYLRKGDKFHYIEPSLNIFALWIILEQHGSNVRGIYCKRSMIENDYPLFWIKREKSVLYAIKIDIFSRTAIDFFGKIETTKDFRNAILKLNLYA